MKMKTGSSYNQELQTYFTVYGISGHQSNIDKNIYDSFMNFENDEINFEKIIDMNDNLIIGVKNADRDKGAVNLKQVTDLLNNRFLALISQINTKQNKSYYNTIFEYFFDLLDPSKFIMSDSFGAVVSGLFGNLIFHPTKLLSDFEPNKGFITDFEINFNENVTGSDDWTMYIAFKYDYKPGDNKRIKITFGGSTLDFPWLKVEHNILLLDYDLDTYSKQIRADYRGKYMNLWYTKIGNQFRIGICNNSICLNKILSGYTLSSSSIQISPGYYVQRIGFSKTAYPINGKVYHKIQFLDKANGVFFE